MRLIVTFGAATAALALMIQALGAQRSATESALPTTGNETAWSAFNATSGIYSDLSVSLANGLPLALIAAFIVGVLSLGLVVSGR